MIEPIEQAADTTASKAVTFIASMMAVAFIFVLGMVFGEDRAINLDVAIRRADSRFEKTERELEKANRAVDLLDDLPSGATYEQLRSRHICQDALYGCMPMVERACRRERGGAGGAP